MPVKNGPLPETLQVPYESRKLILPLDDELFDILYYTDLMTLAVPVPKESQEKRVAQTLKSRQVPPDQLERELRLAKAHFRSRRQGWHIRPLKSDHLGYLHFPPGHPIAGAVYGGHPLRERVYYPLAEFHPRVFEDKVSELRRLLLSLGASSIHIYHRGGWTSVGEGHVTTSQKESSAKVGVSVGSNASGERLVIEEFEAEGSAAPVLPADPVWLAQEPHWLDMVQARLHHGLSSYKLKLEYKTTFGIDFKIFGKLQALSFELGGEWDRTAATTWSVEAKFPVATASR